MTHRLIPRTLPGSLLLCLIITGSAAPRALAVEERIWLSAEAGGHLYDPEQAFRDGLGFGAHGAAFLNRWAGIHGLFRTSSPNLEQPFTGDGTFQHLGGGLILTPDRTRWTLPYIYGGIGSVKVEREPSVGIAESESRSAFHAGAGVLLRIGERLGVRLDGRNVSYEHSIGPGRDTRVNAFQISGAVTALWLGRSRDSDEDGIPNKNDRCPATPAGAVVDASGCPLDSDQDKVWDGLDKCAETPRGAVVDAGGCPIDSDKDGVADGIDQCDSTAAGVLVDARGCGLDADADSVFDGLDQCPETPQGSVVDARGCPVDSDRDGIPDGIDICPATLAGARVNAGGCPLESTPYERQLLADWLIRLTDLEFAPDSARLLPQAIARLDSVAAVLLQWPTLRFELGAHVDDQQEPGYRIPLSFQRARAVYNYLQQANPTLNAKNFTLTAFGDTEPLVPNTSSANRARNRRIEFKVQNPNVLTEERQRRASFGTTPAPPAPGLTPGMPTPPDGETPPGTD